MNFYADFNTSYIGCEFGITMLADTPLPPTGIDSVYNKVKSLHVLYFL